MKHKNGTSKEVHRAPEEVSFVHTGGKCRYTNWSMGYKILTKFQAPNFKNSVPQKVQFQNPSHSMAPLDWH